MTACPWYNTDMDTDPDINTEIYPFHDLDEKSLYEEFSLFP
jgi:hypothetical protein